MLRFGAWFHANGGVPLEEQIAGAKACGISSVRSYDAGYSIRLAPILRETGMTLYAGLHVQPEALLEDWRTQVRFDELATVLDTGVALEAVCVGNELREFGDDPERKRFTARVSFALANVLGAYRGWMDRRGCRVPLTYAMEGIALDREGKFREHLWPLVDACDVVSINLYPMGQCDWHGADQFERSRAFLRDSKTRNGRLLTYEVLLRNVLEALEEAGKPLILSETGFPSAVGFETDAQGLTEPVSDGAAFGEAMERLLAVVGKADADYGGRIRAVYFYEWRDNLHHSKITNIEHSPIHCAFGLCDRFGNPKFDIASLLARHMGG